MPGVNTVTTRRSDLHPLTSAAEKTASRTMPTAADPSRTPEPSYYDISLLQAPVWKWEIAIYFWLGGISGGAFVLSRLAERFGGERFRQVSTLASYVSLAALVPSPPLLIMDLGDPKRFHHMLAGVQAEHADEPGVVDSLGVQPPLHGRGGPALHAESDDRGPAEAVRGGADQ